MSIYIYICVCTFTEITLAEDFNNVYKICSYIKSVLLFRICVTAVLEQQFYTNYVDTFETGI